MSATRKEREEFVSLIAQHAGEFVQFIGANNRPVPYCTVFQFARRLMRYGATYIRIQEDACNAPHARYGQDEYNARMQRLWEARLARNEKKEARIEQRLKELCAAFGCAPVFSGDPRGATIKISVPDGFTNDWGKEGICVPTS